MSDSKTFFLKKERKEIVHKFYNNFAKDYDESRYKSEEQKITSDITKQIVSELLNNIRGSLILDCGCGTGRFTDFFIKKNARVIGIDMSENMLKIAKKKIPSATFIKADIFSLPFKNKIFDAVICSEVLTHLHSYKEPLLEMKRVLKDEGIIIIDIRNILWPHRLFTLLKRMIKRADKDYYPDYVSVWRIKRICNKIGLKVDQFRGTGLSFRDRGVDRIKKEIKRSNSKIRYIAPTLILKIVKTK
jgi:ubiquinone/menaquinone biosynthesis C-methylase UbiE